MAIGPRLSGPIYPLGRDRLAEIGGSEGSSGIRPGLCPIRRLCSIVRLIPGSIPDASFVDSLVGANTVMHDYADEHDRYFDFNRSQPEGLVLYFAALLLAMVSVVLYASYLRSIGPSLPSSPVWKRSEGPNPNSQRSSRQQGQQMSASNEVTGNRRMYAPDWHVRSRLIGTTMHVEFFCKDCGQRLSGDPSPGRQEVRVQELRLALGRTGEATAGSWKGQGADRRSGLNVNGSFQAGVWVASPGITLPGLSALWWAKQRRHQASPCVERNVRSRNCVQAP